MVVRRVHIVLLILLSFVAASAWGASIPARTSPPATRKQVRTRKVVKKVTRKRSRRAVSRKASTSRARGRRARYRRIVWNPLFPGSRELLVRENEQIDSLELPRIADDEELQLLEDSEELVPMSDSSYLSVSSIRLPNRRYCRPWTRDFLEEMAAAYFEEFHKPLVITSLVRTAEQQKKLRRRNRNAAPEEGETVSTHLTGMTFDLYKRGMSRRQHKWVEEYFMPLKQLGLIEPIEERRQPVFHVTVFADYTDWRDSQTTPTESAEQVHSIATATN